MGQTDILGQVVKDLASQPMMVFAGAGVSRRSGVPLASEVIDCVLDRLRVDSSDKEVFKSKRIPFEAFIETLSRVSDLSGLFDVFRTDAASRNHLLFAELAKLGRIRGIATTNFDNLFERALDQVGTPFKLAWRDKDLAALSWSRPELCLAKLHGSIDDQQSLGITIRQVANHRNIATLSKPLSELFCGEDGQVILVIGYSASDQFDINPILRRANGPLRRVVFVSHSTDASSTPTRFDLAKASQTGPFANSPGYVVVCNTDLLVERMWEAFISPSMPPLQSLDNNWITFVDRWYNKVIERFGESTNPYFSGLIFKTASDLSRSNSYLRKALVAGIDIDLEVHLNQLIGNNLRDLGKRHEARTHLSKVIELTKGGSNPLAEALALTTLGIIEADENRFSEAIEIYRSALNVLLSSPDRELEGKCIGNIGIALKNLGGENNLRDALNYHAQALVIAQELGDKKSEGRTLGNIGVTHSDLGARPRAISYYRQARSVAEELGDEYHIAVWLANEGEDMMTTDRLAAKALIQKAITIFDSIGSDQAKYCRHLLKGESE